MSVKLDHIWKLALENTFKDFHRIFFPQIAKHIDFSKEIKIRDKTLIEIFEIEIGKDKETLISEDRYTDFLVEVTLKSKEKRYMLIHVEIQGYKQEIFPERIFDYYCRLRPKAKRENKDLICLCLFIVSEKSYKPNKFLYKFENFKIEFVYPAVNIYELKERALEYIEKNIRNIYAYITLMAIESFKIEKKIKKKNKEEVLKEFIDEFAVPFIKSLLKEGIWGGK